MRRPALRLRRPVAPEPRHPRPDQLLAAPPVPPVEPPVASVHQEVEELMQRLVDASDAATPDLLDALISTWSDQWEALVDRRFETELAYWDLQSVLARAEARRARADLAALTRRQRELARQIGLPSDAPREDDGPEPPGADAAPPTDAATTTPPATATAEPEETR